MARARTCGGRFPVAHPGPHERGVEALPRLLETEPEIKWTLNIRADTQVRDYCGSAAYCYERYRPVWDAARAQGSAIAWHLHYYDRTGRQDTSDANILENIAIGSAALGRPDVVLAAAARGGDHACAGNRTKGYPASYFRSSRALTIASIVEASILAAPGLPAREAYAAPPARANATRSCFPSS